MSTMRNNSQQRFDRWENPLSLPVKLANGTLRVEGYLTRSGIYEYVTEDGTLRREWCPPDDALDSTSLDTLRLVPVTMDHPDGGLVDMENLHDVRIGNVGDKIDTEIIYPTETRSPTTSADMLVKVRATMIIDDADAIAVILAKGRRELSVGYLTDVEEVAGTTPGGERYDAIQRNRRFNHVSLVDAGRAGPAYGIRVDRKDKPAMTTTKLNLDGVPFEATEQTASAVTAAISKREAQIAALEAKAADANKATVAAEARADRADADAKKAAEAAAAAEAAVADRVKARRKLERTALQVLGDAGKDIDLDAVDDDALRAAVVKHSIPDVSLEGKSADYIAASFDIAVAKAATTTATTSQSAQVNTDSKAGAGKLRGDTTAGTNVDPIAEARRVAAERQQNAWKAKG